MRSLNTFKKALNMGSDLSAKEKIKDSAQLVSSKLDAYIKLHNTISKGQGSLWSFVNNLFGKPIPFSGFVQQAKALEKEFRFTIKGLISTKESLANVISNDETTFIDCLLEYTGALSETVTTLRERQEIYFEKNKEFKNIGLNLSSAKAMEKRYQKKILHYQKIGEKLDKLNHIIY